jgi:hypothetical protein
MKFVRIAFLAFLAGPPILMVVAVFAAGFAMSVQEIGWWAVPIWAWCICLVGFVMFGLKDDGDPMP